MAKRATAARAKAAPAKAARGKSSQAARYPFVHVGAGISAARKDWWLTVVFAQPIAAATKPLIESAPPALDSQLVRERVAIVGHNSDSLQWVVAAGYPGKGPRAADGEATTRQWKAFNADVDAYLERLHRAAPITAVIRTVDDEYSTELLPWHAWSCERLAPLLPELASVLTRDDVAALEHACDLWRAWLADLAVKRQGEVLGALDAAVRAVLADNGGVPEPVGPRRPAKKPTLDEQRAAWRAIPSDAIDVWARFGAAFPPIDDEPWELDNFRNALLAKRDREAVIEVTRRAVRDPACEWPDTHWRPDLVDALVQLRRRDDAKPDLARVAAAATSYGDSNWHTMIGWLDAAGRRDDADAIFHVARRYVSSFGGQKRRVGRKPRDNKERAAAALLDLTAPYFAALDGIDDEAVNHTALFFEKLVKEGHASAALSPLAKQARDELVARTQRRRARGTADLQRGGRTDRDSLAVLLEDAQSGFKKIALVDVERLARAAAAHPTLIPGLEALAYAAHGKRPEVSLAVLRVVMAMPEPAAKLEGGGPRGAWLRSLNSALAVLHRQKLYDEGAAAADTAVRYARDNPYITHNAACCYVAVGRLDDALAQVKLAVELHYPGLDKLQADPDLNALRQRPDFKALFAGRKSRAR
jgi:hypothetical protein